MWSAMQWLKRYKIPVLLFAAALFFQLVVNPSAFPASHYEVLGVKGNAPVEEVTEAYENLLLKWNSSGEIPKTSDFVKVRYAFELLSNPVWKRDYDIFGVDEYQHILDKVREKYKLEDFTKVQFPLLDPSASDHVEHRNDLITAENFKYAVETNSSIIIQVFSAGSFRSAKFLRNWERIGAYLEGIASTFSVELGEVKLAAYLADRKSTGQPFFLNGLPAIVAIPAGCKSSQCIVRYTDELSVDSVIDWVATNILGLPRILYHTKETLVSKFISESGPHKVKVIYFSKTGERAAPFLRQAAKKYWAYASFSLVLWREEESSLWWSTLEVESAPAVVFVKDPIIKPIVYHGSVNSSWFFNIMEQNKLQELPQLRTLTSMDLGCDARGYSRAGLEAKIWYCMIVVGKPSMELSKMRETLRRLQGDLLNEDETDSVNGVKTSTSIASRAAKEKRLTFTWLDGEVQKNLCFFYVHSAESYETCGPKRYGDVDSPQLVLVRYKRNTTTDDVKVEKKSKPRWTSVYDEVDENLASMLVARYNGSTEIPEITKWISKTVEDGDSIDLPFFTTKSPDLVPESSEPARSTSARGMISRKKGLKQLLLKLASDLRERIGDPRIGPALLLAACISFGSIYMSNRAAQLNERNIAKAKSEPSSEAITSGTDRDPPTSITDEEPKDAYQLLSSGSDIE